MATKGSKKAEISQIDAVIEVMKTNGGSATLNYLNQHATKVPGSVWAGTKTPFASIRRIVQDTGKAIEDRRFVRIRPGLWALKEFAQAEQQLPAQERDAFSHAYYQGLLVELGNMQAPPCQTAVPAQDKNQQTPSGKLGELATLKTHPPYTYPDLVKCGSFVDVVWFQPHPMGEGLLMPKAFYEVEHSTGIERSLTKFTDLLDFRADFIIVADDLRREEFAGILKRRSHQAIRPFVRFLSYKSLTRQYEKASEDIAPQSLAP